MRLPLWVVAVPLFLSLTGLAGRAASTGASVQGQNRPLFSARSELVLLHVTVKDGRDAYVGGLPQDAFTIFDNDKPQPIRFFLDEDAPVTVGLLVDSSGSMQPNRALVTAAASSFVDTSNPRDEIFALTFNDEVHPVLPSFHPFTSDSNTLREALARTMTTQGRTALYDAFLKGMEYVDTGAHTRKVLVVVSDGADTASEASLDDVAARLQAANVVVYAIALIDPLEADGSPGRLRRLTTMTGGETFVPRDASHVQEVLERIARDIRHAYVVAYEPADPGPGERLRRIRVVVRDAQHRRLAVRARAGYLAGGDR